jgi:hypothetical protein
MHLLRVGFVADKKAHPGWALVQTIAKGIGLA